MGPFKPLPDARKTKVVSRTRARHRSTLTAILPGTGRDPVAEHIRETQRSLLTKSAFGV